MDEIAERQGGQLQHQELTARHDEHQGQRVDDPADGSRGCSDSCNHPLLHHQNEFEDDLQQDRGEQRKQEGFGDHPREQFGEHAQHHQVDEHVHQINRSEPHLPSLSGRGGARPA
ncbi:hypothetical protein SDC9_113067 [bioreactor metagenome]|uniref:Uncharacterized protein n=1 Tax=bioreactor metagenome TaxID=1076179 RepID=A0A645BL14_9ZZZZ